MRAEPRRLTRDEALAMAPVRRGDVREERSPGGALILNGPLPLHPWLLQWERLARLAARPGGSPEGPRRRVELDDKGEVVWSLIDGRRSVRDIAALLAERSGLGEEEARQGVAALLRQLGRRGLIGLRPPA